MALSETIIVNNPNGYSSMPTTIQTANQMMCSYTNIIEPANRVMASAMRF